MTNVGSRRWGGRSVGGLLVWRLLMARGTDGGVDAKGGWGDWVMMGGETGPGLWRGGESCGRFGGCCERRVGCHCCDLEKEG